MESFQLLKWWMNLLLSQMCKFTRKPDMALSFILFTESFRTDGAGGQLIWDIYLHAVWQTSWVTMSKDFTFWGVALVCWFLSMCWFSWYRADTTIVSWRWVLMMAFLSPSLPDNLLPPHCWWKTSITWVSYLAELRKETQVKALSYELGWVDRSSIRHGYFLGTFIRCWVMGWVQVRRDWVS